jgi:hypothetical protein
MGASFGDGLKLHVAEGGTTIWSLSSSATEVALWIVGPPLILWAAWMIRRRRVQADEALAGERGLPELPLPQASEIEVERPGRRHVGRPGDRASHSR